MNEVSIWVDQFLGAISGHGMFVHSLCSEKVRNKYTSKLIQWNQPGTTYFDRKDLPLSCCKVKKFETVFHLFCLGEAAWGAFHGAHVLNELDFQPDLAGMIVVIERESVLHWFKITSHKDGNRMKPVGGIHFRWFEKQSVPYVIAASGYQGAKKELEQLRKALGVNIDIPMIPGPSLSQGDSLSLDTEHANQVLTVLHDLLEFRRSRKKPTNL